MPRLVGGLVMVVVGLTALFAARFFERAGVFTPLAQTDIPGCRSIEAPIGDEDLQIDPASGWVFVSSFDFRAGPAADRRGGLYAFRPEDPQTHFIDLTDPALGGMPEDFRPHGLSLHFDEDTATLAVINHRVRSAAIELFRLYYLDDGAAGTLPRLQHLWTVESPLLRSPNDIVLVGPDSFYVTNDHWYPPGLRRRAETFFMLGAAQLLYGEGRHVRVGAEGLAFGNGIAVSADGRVLYVAETLPGRLRVYDRNPETGDLRLRPGREGRVPIHRGPDNIDRAADGALWIAHAPKAMRYLAHLKDPSALSPTEVTRVPVDARGAPGRPQRILLDNGARLSAGSVAAYSGGRVIVGSPFAAHVLICPYGEGE